MTGAPNDGTRASRFWLAVGATTIAWLALLVWLHAGRPRVLVSWHGFLHAAIATRFPSATLPPENPFFAGQPLPYYWFYHFLGWGVSRALQVDLLHAFQWLTLMSFVVLVVAGALIGRRCFRSTAAGLVIGFLAIAGLNPLGPAIAMAKHVLRGVPLFATAAATDSVFVTNRLADEWMTQPLLPAMYVMSDWRRGDNLVWFFDISARAPALALLVVLLLLMLTEGADPRRVRLMGIGLVAALLTALNPLIGLLVAGVALGVTGALGRQLGALRPFLACLVGAVVALPTYYQLFVYPEGAPDVLGPSRVALRLAAVSADFLVLAPLAVLGAWRAAEHGRLVLRTALGTALLFVGIAVGIRLPQGNEHNLLNAAQCLLAVPAGVFIVGLGRPDGGFWRRHRWTLGLVALFIPTALGTLVAFTGRPGLPLAFRDAQLIRLPETGPLGRFYDWVRARTPRDAVFIVDPSDVVKMSGNVSELPAFTGRTLFTDQRSYLTAPYPDAGARARLASRAANGQPLAAPQLDALRALRRPLYLVSYRADRQDLLARLAELYGSPVFAVDFVAVFGVDPNQRPRPEPPPEELELRFSAYLGGSATELVRDMAVDHAGYAYAVGAVVSRDFPTTPGSYQPSLHPGPPAKGRISESDVFVAKIAPDGRLVWSTFIGGPNFDGAYAVDVDREGYVYVAGRAGAGFPVTPGSFQPQFMGGEEAAFYGPQDGFVCKLTPNGAKLVFCSYLGTSDARIVRDLAVDLKGDVYVASGYSEGVFPDAVRRAFTNRPAGGDDAVVAKIASDGSRVLWATYLGGTAWESNENSVGIDAVGHPYVLLTTESRDIPTTPGAYDRTFAGDQDLYVARLTPDSGRLVWATYLGGPDNESTETHEFAVDAAGHAYVAAPTGPRFAATTPGTFQRVFGGGSHDLFVAKFSPDGSRLLACTFIGGNGADRAEGVVVDAGGNVYFTGTTTSSDFPVTPNAFRTTRTGPRDAVAVKLASDFSRLLYASYLGGSGAELGRAAAIDSSGSFYFGGETWSRDFPVLGPRSSGPRGESDGFIARLAAPAPRRPAEGRRP